MIDTLILVGAVVIFVCFLIGLVPAWLSAYRNHPDYDRLGRRKRS